jgi:hypothetical protein
MHVTKLSAPNAVITLIVALALAGCAMDVAPGSEAPPPSASSAQELMVTDDIPKCKKDEQLCCLRYTCVCIPEKNTCSGNMVLGNAVLTP